MTIIFPNHFDQVGSLLRPSNLQKARLDFSKSRIDQDTLTEIENEEIKNVVSKQIELGFKDVTDGEFRRSWWHLDFYAGFLGTKYFIPEKGWNFAGIQTRPGGIKIIDHLQYNPNHPFFAAFNYLQKIVPEGITAKQTIPSPTVFFPNKDAHILNEAYDNLDNFYQDLILIYQQTIQHFYDLGCRYLQLDDTTWGMWASFAHDSNSLKLSPELTKQAEIAVRILNQIIDQKPSDMTMTMHVCRGNYQSVWAGSGDYAPVAKYLAKLHLDGFFLEYDDKRSGDFSPLAQISNSGRNQRIILGLITSKTSKLENENDLIKRIKQASEYFPIDHLGISTQCGFASTEEGNKLTIEDQWKKLALVIKTANLVWPS